MSNENDTTSVRYQFHTDRIDLAGRDLISILGKVRADVSALIGLDISDQSLTPIQVPTEKVTSMAGVVADEVHDWPHAAQGHSFHSLSLHFKESKLITLEWNFSLVDFLPKKKAWYRRWFGRQ